MPTKIKKLVLRELKDLKYMWKQDSKLDFIIQNLEVLQVWYCDSLIHLMSPSASFQNLTVLEVKYCRNLTNFITSSTAKSLVQLIQMSILNCKKMTEVVGNQGVIEDRIIFSKLKSLSLQFLPNLRSFCSVNSTLEFPSLEELTMTGCPRMKNFSQGVSSTPTLRKIEINWNSIELYSESDINNAIQQFHEKTAFPCLEQLILAGKQVTMIWQGQSLFDKLKILEVRNDELTVQQARASNYRIATKSKILHILQYLGQTSKNAEAAPCSIEVLTYQTIFSSKQIILPGK
ncbi:hypothetical protein Ddye_028185 [Dipteronia dyeriana]|uniref:Disease resistance protein At4g27190-like leucine-rich repeats domain-containing protein n=1 Tax=Dipteronia dyeriana TaxID=168575 RepID=A0AAD9TRE0_9ROSI|nr:hypothetical protein Ddye_028185 [Dipteronia dyeriana]